MTSWSWNLKAAELLELHGSVRAALAAYSGTV
jgi:hypothetical protein